MPGHAIMDAVSAFSWDLLKIAGGGLVASTITLVVSGRRQDRDLHRTASALAIQLIDQLERFALACSRVPGENAGNERRDPYDSTGMVGLPAFPELPKDEAGWRALATDLAIDCRTFPTKINLAHDMISAEGDHGDADDVEVEINKQSMILGLAAWALAVRMRERFSLGKAAPGWDVQDAMSGRLSQMKAREVARWASNAAMVAELSAVAPDQATHGAS
jgi:hypothetical protein